MSSRPSLGRPGTQLPAGQCWLRSAAWEGEKSRRSGLPGVVTALVSASYQCLFKVEKNF